MSLFITSLNSGSNGNCYYIGNSREAVLVDAGISCREIEKRMKRLRLSMNHVKAVFISHEHSDHIRGIPVLATKYRLPVFVSTGTLRYCPISIDNRLVNYFGVSEPIVIGELSIAAFPKLHDAAEPHSFRVSCKGVHVGVFTDIGTPCSHLTYHFRQCHAAFLEANYDEQLLETGRYPVFLKNRIRGGRGHLSNRQALQLFTTHKPLHMSHLILSHLSHENNCPKLVYQLFHQHAGGIEISVASRFEETPVYTISNQLKISTLSDTIGTQNQPVQMSLF